MSHKRYAFINSDGIVVQVIIGTLDAAAQAQFLRDYAALFGAVAIIEVYADTPVWIGGTYADGSSIHHLSLRLLTARAR